MLTALRSARVTGSQKACETAAHAVANTDGASVATNRQERPVACKSMVKIGDRPRDANGLPRSQGVSSSRCRGIACKWVVTKEMNADATACLCGCFSPSRPRLSMANYQHFSAHHPPR
ncbi:MAG: hypothetical protein DCC68_09615 [Planctomycetota bacterium]|nr:MAG: hypothetical protein DCC68_09615 [Planctomycetota bacterium]